MAATRKDGRQYTARQIGGFGEFTATGGSTSTAVCAAAFKSTELPTSAFAYQWLYSPASTTPRERRVKASGLAPLSGTITLDDVLGTAIANGTVFELHSKLAAESGSASEASIHDCLADALKHVLIEDTRTLILTSGQQDYTLTDTWLDRRSRLKDVREPNVFGTGKRSTIRTFELRPTIGGAVLHFDQPYRFTDSGTIELDVLRPAWSKVAVGGVWADSTTGPVNDTDQVWLDVQAWGEVALVFAYKTLAGSRGTSSQGTYQKLYADQLNYVRQNVAGYDHDSDIDPSVPGAAQPSAAA